MSRRQRRTAQRRCVLSVHDSRRLTLNSRVAILPQRRQAPADDPMVTNPFTVRQEEDTRHVFTYARLTVSAPQRGVRTSCAAVLCVVGWPNEQGSTGELQGSLWSPLTPGDWLYGPRLVLLGVCSRDALVHRMAHRCRLTSSRTYMTVLRRSAVSMRVRANRWLLLSIKCALPLLYGITVDGPNLVRAGRNEHWQWSVVGSCRDPPMPCDRLC